MTTACGSSGSTVCKKYNSASDDLGLRHALHPIHVYGIQALKPRYDHLTKGTPLPRSQVVRTVPRGGVPGAAPPITAANVPPIAQHPAAGNRIRFRNGTLHVPD
jgi:hydroxybutyrate-dimer hydrolase